MKTLHRQVLLAGSLLSGIPALTAGPSGGPATSFVVGQVSVNDPRIVDLTGDYTLSQGDRSLQLAITQDARGNLVTSATVLLQGSGLATAVGPFSLGGKLQLSGTHSLRVQIAGGGVDRDQDDDGINDDVDQDDDNDGTNDDLDTDEDHGGHGSDSNFVSKQHGGDDGVGDDNGGSGGGSDDTTSATNGGSDDPAGDDHGGLTGGSDDPAGDDDHDGVDNGHDTDDDNDGVDDSHDDDDDNDGIDDQFENRSRTTSDRGRSEAVQLRGTFNGSVFQVVVGLKGFGGNRTFTASFTPQNPNHTLTVTDAHSTQNGSSYTSTREVTTPSGSFSTPALQQNRGSAVRFAIKSGSFGMDLRGTSDDETFTPAQMKLHLGYGNAVIDAANVSVSASAL